MSFDRHYPNRKDHRAPYYNSAERVDRGSRPHGSSDYARANRLIHDRRVEAADRANRRLSEGA